jgi:hypothetical protein
MSKLFVRERGNVGKGEETPRFEIVAVSGVELKVYHSHVRKLEVEKIAADVGAEIVYLPRGEGGEMGEKKADKKRRKGKGRQKEQ